MNIITGKNILAAVIFTAFIFTVTASLAWDFNNQPAKKLKALDADEQEQTVVVESPDGDTAVLTVGDEVGEEKAVITKVLESGAVLEAVPDSSGNSEQIFIPADIFRSAQPVSPEEILEPPAGNPYPGE